MLLGAKLFRTFDSPSCPSAIAKETSEYCATLAQLVEQGTENPRVAGSIPAGGTIFLQLAPIERVTSRFTFTLIMNGLYG